jgi:hypothetical protein
VVSDEFILPLEEGFEYGLRVSMSALVGDPDLYPWVYRLSKLKLRSM